MARILIADDEAILTMYLEEILSMNDHDVVGSASSGPPWVSHRSL